MASLTTDEQTLVLRVAGTLRRDPDIREAILADRDEEALELIRAKAPEVFRSVVERDADLIAAIREPTTSTQRDMGEALMTALLTSIYLEVQVNEMHRRLEESLS